MASTKVTFTLDDAVGDFRRKHGRSPAEDCVDRARLFMELVAKIPSRDPADTRRELDELREARRTGGRRTPAE